MVKIIFYGFFFIVYVLLLDLISSFIAICYYYFIACLYIFPTENKLSYLILSYILRDSPTTFTYYIPE